MNELLCIIGPTATGKTKLAVHVANKLNGEIISADSRQVYRGMDIGTGKDLDEYSMFENVPYHLIDIVDAGYEFNLFEYQKAFLKVYNELKTREVLPILCGGTGLYIESVTDCYDLVKVPENLQFRESIKTKTNEELAAMLTQTRDVHNTTDTIIRERIIRAIEIDQFKQANENPFPKISSMIFCMDIKRELLHQRIKARLLQRINEGMIEEVENLINSGVPEAMLEHYGLEYRYVLNYLNNEFSKDEMIEKLYIAIRQFAKRQIKWFRRMERNGSVIHWLDAEKDVETLAQELFFAWQSSLYKI
ncbi:MAG: tRNA (adenosine(37)-N6)-dimethylallyltransferase MiaA [Kiritimatiellae bacterium]|jgi:tRNA dimethylallyltransferase|nr:tRNA (adenosine(37)-N6)-dimethylallyltransferase MiaA [Kiritimatiellia bacterium]